MKDIWANLEGINNGIYNIILDFSNVNQIE